MSSDWRSSRYQRRSRAPGARLRLDPLTGAVRLKEIANGQQMLEAERQWMPQFEGRSIRPTPTISIPKDVKPASAPIDPALAIFARFGELMG
jgi:alpha-galactosidase